MVDERLEDTMLKSDRSKSRTVWKHVNKKIEEQKEEGKNCIGWLELTNHRAVGMI